MKLSLLLVVLYVGVLAAQEEASATKPCERPNAAQHRGALNIPKDDLLEMLEKARLQINELQRTAKQQTWLIDKQAADPESQAAHIAALTNRMYRQQDKLNDLNRLYAELHGKQHGGNRELEWATDYIHYISARYEIDDKDAWVPLSGQEKGPRERVAGNSAAQLQAPLQTDISRHENDQVTVGDCSPTVPTDPYVP